MGTERSSAVKYVSGSGSLGDLPYGRLERLMAKDHSDLKGELTREGIWNMVTLICCAAVIGVVQTWGPMMITPGRAPSDNVPMNSGLSAVLMPLSLLLGGIGLLMIGVTWWKQGRLRRYEFAVAALVSIVCCGATARWARMSDDVSPFAFVLTWIDIALAGIVLVLLVFASRRGNARVAGFEQLGEKIRALPEVQQEAILASRDEVFACVLNRDPGMRGEIEQARRLPVGDLSKAERFYVKKHGWPTARDS